METSLTGEKRIIRDSKGRFIKGSHANPKGRGIGVRDKANQIKLAFFDAFFELGGKVDIKKWAYRQGNKKEFLKIIASLLPKDLDIQGQGLNETKIIIVRANENKKDMSDLRERI